MNNIIYIMLNDKSIAVALDILKNIQSEVRNAIPRKLNIAEHIIVEEAVNQLGYGFFGIYMNNNVYTLTNLSFMQLDKLICDLKLNYYGNMQKPLKSVPHFDFRGV